MQLVSGKVRLKTVPDHLARIITISLGYLGLERHREVWYLIKEALSSKPKPRA